MTSQPRGVSPDPGKLLDERTETLMRWLCDVGIRHAVAEVEPAKDALRDRIRELIAEALREDGAYFYDEGIVP